MVSLLLSRDVFRTLSKICDWAFLWKYLTALTCFTKKLHDGCSTGFLMRFCFLWANRYKIFIFYYDHAFLFRVNLFCAHAPFYTLHKKMKFSIMHFFSKCNQIRRKLWVWAHFLEKYSDVPEVLVLDSQFRGLRFFMNNWFLAVCPEIL